MQCEEEITQMTPSTQNLNSKLSPSVQRGPAPPKAAGMNWTASAIQSSAPPVRIVGSRSRYQGGYRVNV
jgi:hypothetical protein